MSLETFDLDSDGPCRRVVCVRREVPGRRTGPVVLESTKGSVVETIRDNRGEGRLTVMLVVLL